MDRHVRCSLGFRFDAADLATESTFWAELLGGTIDAEDEFHMVFVDGAPRIGVQLAPDHVAPQWPHGAPQQVHLDLWVDDIAAAHDEVIACGATLLKVALAGVCRRLPGLCGGDGGSAATRGLTRSAALALVALIDSRFMP